MTQIFLPPHIAPSPLLQRKDGKPAKGTTAQEVVDYMKELESMLLEDESWWDKLGYTEQEQTDLREWKQEKVKLQERHQQLQQQAEQLLQQLQAISAAFAAQRLLWAQQLAAAQDVVTRSIAQQRRAPSAPAVMMQLLQAHLQLVATQQQLQRTAAQWLAAQALVLQQVEAAKAQADTAATELQAHLAKDRAHPFFCFDNPHVHHQAKKMLEGKLWEQPTYSPDFNKPVEHAIGIISSTVKKEVSALSMQGERSTDMAFWQQRILAAFHNLSPEGLSKDIHSLKETWIAVATEAPGGAAGGWPDKRYR